MSESLNDVAVGTLALVDWFKEGLRGINDFGEVTGLQDEYEQIVNDAHALLGTLRSRAFKLKRRVGLYREQATQSLKPEEGV